MKSNTPTLDNRKARFDYAIEETIEAGIVLKGTEVKSIRDSKISFVDSHARVIKKELWLFGMNVARYKSQNSFEEYNPVRSRKLLLKKREIEKLEGKLAERGYTIIPLKLYFKRGKVKILLGIGKGKKLYDKRESIKRREIDKEAAQAMKRSYKSY